MVLALLLGRNPFTTGPLGNVPNVMITLFLLALYGVLVGGVGPRSSATTLPATSAQVTPVSGATSVTFDANEIPPQISRIATTTIVIQRRITRSILSEPDVVRKILLHLALPADVPPTAPAQHHDVPFFGDDFFQTGAPARSPP